MTITENSYALDNLLIRKQRHIIKRIVVRGTLILDTPTCLGSGDAESPTDLALLRDSISDRALLTGSSIAGALRNYLRECQHGYMAGEQADDLATILFGGMRSDDDGNQSPLIINDSISTKPIQAELRDGVKINSITRTAADKAKYDLELLQAGTEFPLCFELLIEKDSNETELRKGLAIALSGLEPKNDAKSDDAKSGDAKSGEISLGMKKRRGFGRCHVKEWQVWDFDLTDESDRIAWLTLDHSWLTDPPCIKPPAVDASIVAAMKKAGLDVPEDWEDQRDRFTIKATFKLVSSLLIRSGLAETGRAPDVVHLKSHRPGKTDAEPVLSGTSLAGVLRHRAERIVNTLHEVNSQITQEIVNDIFGFVTDKKELSKSESQENDKKLNAKASRLIVHESVIKYTTDLVQTRIAIDRFTGGAYHGALFQEKPVFANDKTELKLEIELRKPDPHEIGLLLLLLKDLWTEDLPVGGSSSVGRGRLQGKVATLVCSKEGKSWTISQPNLKENYLEIIGSDRQDLENYVVQLVEYTKQEVTSHE
ncbi:MAG: RAMP superfamily CRISPR-associated protein [Actinomycetota bacterium]